MLGLLLPRGGNAFLGENGAALKRIELGLAWQTGEREIDLDASVFLLTKEGKVRGDNDLIFYHAPVSSCRSVRHHGDSRGGGSGQDDELITVELDRVPPQIERVAVTVTIHNEPGAQAYRFADLSAAHVRVTNVETGTEILRYELASAFGEETALIFSELYRYKEGWKFRAVGQGFVGGLRMLCRHYGVVVDD